jgi:hypothetical protein
VTKVPLPRVETLPNSTAHPYPLQVGFQTLEFIQATYFHAILADIAAGEAVRQPGGIGRIEAIMLEKGMNRPTLDQGWALLSKYQAVFEDAVFQSATVALNSHWDWLIRRLGAFIAFARDHCAVPTLRPADAKRLKRLEALPLGEQVAVIEAVAGIVISLSADRRKELAEMALVRNIGIHNRWEVDARYRRMTEHTNMAHGDLRMIEISELSSWHRALTALVPDVSLQCAKAFLGAPAFVFEG